ncbi:hypothetical protein EBS40_07585 [bacterium]|nr:hypothetical protein [bacterium]
MPTSFKVEILKGVHNFSNPGGNTFKIALFKGITSGTGAYGPSTTNYSEMGSNELSTGNGYTAGGITLTPVTPVADGTSSVVTFATATWSAASFTSAGALIYNTSASNAACAVISFGGDQTALNQTFQLQFPSPTASTAIIRIN